MKYDLATLVRRLKNPRRSTILIRHIAPTEALASDLYQRSYRPLVAAIAHVAERVIVEYERTVTVSDGVFRDSAADIQAILDDAGGFLNRLVLSLAPSLRDWAVRVERYHRGKWRGALLTAAGVDVETLLLASGEPKSVADTIAWNTSLIRDVSDQARGRISSAVFAAIQQRKPARDLAKEIREVVAMSRRRSIGIASDQTSKLSGALDTERMSDAGIERWKYRHSGKLHPRSWHRHRDGRIYDLATSKEIDGDDVIAPGDAPTEPPWCGCRKQALLVLS